MELADKFVHPTAFTGAYPNWAGYAWLDWSKEAGCYHPGDDYNFGSGDQDCGQDVGIIANGTIFHTSKSTAGYGNLIIAKHQIGYNLKRFVKETYGIETDTLYSLYAHLKDIIVSAGNEISAGSLIAHVGKTGTQYCHLHCELYHLEGDLKQQSYRFYPVGWSKEKIAQNWLPVYKFIEAVRNIDTYETFLGKSKEYWLQIEKDRENLLKQIKNVNDEILKVAEPLRKEIEELKKQNQQKQKEIDNFDEKQKVADIACKNEVKKVEDKLLTATNKIQELQNRITEILKNQSSNYTAGEAWKIFINSLFSKKK